MTTARLLLAMNKLICLLVGHNFQLISKKRHGLSFIRKYKCQRCDLFCVEGIHHRSRPTLRCYRVP